MMQVKINGAEYTCKRLITRIADYEWDMRDVQELVLPMTHAEADALFVDGAAWSYIHDEGDEPIDCSEYSIAGDITDHRDGTVSVRMGKPTATELELRDAKAALALLGVTEQEEIENDNV